MSEEPASFSTRSPRETREGEAHSLDTYRPRRVRPVIMAPPDEPRNASTADDQSRRIELDTDAALAHLNVEDLSLELLERVQALLEADTAAVLWLDASAEATAAKGIEAEVHQGVRIGYSSQPGRTVSSMTVTTMDISTDNGSIRITLGGEIDI
jgi:hypothetical protein